jgi:hypothetical protein
MALSVSSRAASAGTVDFQKNGRERRAHLSVEFLL